MNLIIELLEQLNESEGKPPKKNKSVFKPYGAKQNLVGRYPVDSKDFRYGDYVEVTDGEHKGKKGYVIGQGRDKEGYRKAGSLALDLSDKVEGGPYNEEISVDQKDLKIAVKIEDNPPIAKMMDENVAKSNAKKEKVAATKAALFTTSTGKEADFNLQGTVPKMTWTGDPLKVGNKMRVDFDPRSETGFSVRNQVKKRTAAEIKETKDIVAVFKKDLDAFAKHMEDGGLMKPNTKSKEQALKNGYKVAEAAQWVADNIDDFYNELLRVNIMVTGKGALRDEKDLEKLKEVVDNIKKICYKAAEYSKITRTRMTLPNFASVFRTQSAIELGFMLHARDYLKNTLKKVQMTPEQRARSEKASERMKAMWNSLI